MMRYARHAVDVPATQRRLMKDSPIVPTVDFEKDGVQHGFLRLPWSRDDSAWGNLMIPIAVIRNGDGPTALLTGANHGDEYEGPIALVDLARTLRRRTCMAASSSCRS